MNTIILIILILISSCDEPVVTGCTTPSACNFDPRADKSDGSCIPPQGCNDWCDGMTGAPGLTDCDNNCCDPIEELIWDTATKPYTLTNTQCYEEDNCANCLPNGVDDEDACAQDCNGFWNNSNDPTFAMEDNCGICDADTSNDCIQDCFGEWGGNASADECGVCTGGATGLEPNYTKDCDDVCFGTAIIDDCDICTGGDTGFIPNFLKDECGVCNGDGYRENCLNGSCNQMDCSGVCITNEGYSINNECSNECENCGWQPAENCIDCETYGECVLFGSTLDSCQVCSDGISNHEFDSDKDCQGVCFGPYLEDCTGLCCIEGEGSCLIGTGEDEIGNDECGVCNGVGAILECGCFSIPDGECDCNGNTIDECNICGGNGPVNGENCDGDCIEDCADPLDCNLGIENGGTGPGLDCLGNCGGTALKDECGICNGNNTYNNCIGTNDCSSMDCNAVCDGSAVLDCAGLCNGGSVNDCAGQCNGNSALDPNFGIDNCTEENGYIECDNNPSNDCEADCAGVWAGNASIDNCGTCSGGNTGIEPNQGTTPDELYSCSDINLLMTEGVCEYEEDSDDSNDCANISCPTLIWENENLIGFNFSTCFTLQTDIPEYLDEFNIKKLYLNDQDISDFSSIISISSLEEVNLSNNSISSIPEDFCTLVENPCTITLSGNFIGCAQIPTCNSGTIICD